MGKLMATGSVLGSVLIGAVVWFVLFVIIGVTLWVSFVVWGAIIVAGLLTAPLLHNRIEKSQGQTSSRRHQHKGPIGAR